jgi:prepilin-type N-terminal cleavage/methylation domain-containing protein
MKKNVGNRGFTLIEMLVVIAIIVILTGIIVTNLAGARGKARDGKRVSDVAQIQLSLEQFFDRCQQYPLALLPLSVPCPTVGSVTLGSYISAIPTPPTPGQGSYDYWTNAANNNNVATDYVLHIQLENKSDVLNDSLKTNTTPGWFSASPTPGFNCYNGSTPYDYCVGTK